MSKVMTQQESLEKERASYQAIADMLAKKDTTLEVFCINAAPTEEGVDAKIINFPTFGSNSIIYCAVCANVTQHIIDLNEAMQNIGMQEDIQ